MADNSEKDEEIRQILLLENDQRSERIDELRLTALEGSEQKQLLLGKYYLTVSNTEDADSNSPVQAVYWLCKASRQGNEEATTLLAECLENNHGLTESNLSDVSWCVNTPQLEKIARQAAISLYKKLNPLEGQGLSKDEYLKAVSGLTDSKVERKLLEKAAKFKSSHEVTEEDFVDKITKKLIHGSSSVTTLLSTDVEEEAYNSASWVKKITKYPAKTLTTIVDYTVQNAGKQGMVWLKSLIPTHQIYMLLVFFVYSNLSVQLMLWFIPLFLFYISFIAMMINTMQMFYAKRKQSDIRNLARMLNKFNDAMDSDSAESSFSLQSLTPYFSFFVALIVSVLAFAMSDKAWIPCSELLCISLFFTCTCFFALNDKYDFLIIMAIFFNLLSTMPVFLETMPYIPGLYHVLHLFVGTVYSVDIVPGMSLNLGFPSLAYLVVPALFVRMAWKNSWQGTYRILIPHLVCFFWWQVAVTFYRYSTWFGMIRASIGWVTLLVMLPVIAILIFLYLAFFVFKLFTLANILKFVTTIILLTIPVVFGIWAKKGFKVKGFSLEDKTKKAKIVLVVLFCISVIPMVYFITPPERDVEGKYISWDQYKQFCSKPQWDKTNIADAMIKCSHLQDSMIQWQGKVKKVVLKKLDNQADSFLSHLPFSVANWLRCTYGDEYPDCDTIEDVYEKELCQLSTMQNKKCHLKRLNRYTFDLWITLPIDPENSHDVRLEASDWFKETMLELKQGDDVSFRGMLKSNLGNTWPEIRLFYIERKHEGMVDIQSGSKTLLPAETWSVVEKVKCAFFETWNFFVAPVITLSTNNGNGK